MTEFPDRNLDFLHNRVASGKPTYLDGETPQYLAVEDVAALPVGTLLEDDAAEHARYLWVRVEGDELYCIYAELDGQSTVKGLGTVIPADQHTSLRIVGSLPGSPTGRVDVR